MMEDLIRSVPTQRKQTVRFSALRYPSPILV